MQQEIQRRLVWSGWYRLSHLMIGGAALVLWFSGWLLTEAPGLAQAALDYHYLAAGLLVAGLVLRLVLALAGRPVERAGALVPGPGDWPGIQAMLRFYLSLGKAPLPRWYGQNPFWKPFYWLMYGLLILLLLSGVLQQDQPVLLGWYLPALHRMLAAWLFWLLLLHLLTVLLHDYRGSAAELSSMVNGYRYFVIERSSGPKPEIQSVAIRLDQIGQKPDPAEKSLSPP